MTHNLFIVDDHFMLRKGIAAYLEEKTFWRITGTFADSKSCLEELNRGASELPEIIIIDI